MRSTSTCTARQQHLSSTASTSSTSARQAAPGRQCLSRASTTAAPARPCTWWAPWQAAPCTWSARPRARCCKVEIPVQFHLPELNFPMRTGEKSDFVPRFVPRSPSCYPPRFAPCWGGCRKFFRHIPSAPRAAAPEQHSSTASAQVLEHQYVQCAAPQSNCTGAPRRRAATTTTWSLARFIAHKLLLLRLCKNKLKSRLKSY